MKPNDCPVIGQGAGVERIAVFRALMLGDLLCAVPALRALRAGHPGAEITLVGLPWARELAGRLTCVDRFIAFPGHPGLPEVVPDVFALPGFLREVQAARFDLALQLHGSGGLVNPIVASFGARHTAGFHDGQCWYPAADAARYVPWPAQGHEIERLLALTDVLGLPRQGRQLDFPVQDADRRALTELLPDAGAWPFAVVHAGAQLPSRRWPVERFARVADRLAAQGLGVVLTGGPGETGLVAALGEAMEAPALNLAGRTSLWALGALIERADVLVCNDTGVSHIAAAFGTRSVVISSGADVSRWAPLDAALHPVLWQPMACRPCSHRECPVGHGCALAIEPGQVVETLASLGTVAA